MNLFPTVFLLGLAGFDPTGALVIISALTMGINKKQIVKFAATTFFGTVLVGLVFSTILSTGIDAISKLLNSIPDIVYMWVELIIGIALLIWAFQRFFCKKKTVKKEENKESFFIKFLNKGLFAVGLIFAITALTDPSFLALITASSHNDNILLVILANAIWILISQSPIFVLTVAVIFNKHEKVINFFDKLLNKNDRKEKIKKVLSILLSVLLLSAGILIIVDSIYFWINGIWIF